MGLRLPKIPFFIQKNRPSACTYALAFLDCGNRHEVFHEP